MKPTVGRIVYYKTRGSLDGVYPPKNMAAIVTAVYDDKTAIDLVVFGEQGLRFERSVENGNNAGMWDWMPFQKDQQKRVEAMDNKLSEERNTDTPNL